MTVSDLAVEKTRQIDRDVAFDLLLDRVSRGFGGIFSHTSYHLVLILYVAVILGDTGASYLTLLPIAVIPVAKVLALLGALAWLSYGLFAMRRRSRIELELLKAQINTLRLQQLAAQL